MKLALLAGCLLASLTARADVRVYTQTFGEGNALGFATGMESLTEVPAFDPRTGVLRSITVSFDGTFTGSMYVENSLPVPMSGSLGFRPYVAVVGFRNLGQVFLNPVLAPFALEAAPDATTLPIGPTAVSGSTRFTPSDPGFSPFGIQNQFFQRFSFESDPVLGVGTAAHQASLSGVMTVAYDFAPFTDAVSREVSLFLPPEESAVAGEAISREWSLFLAPEEPAFVAEAISREWSLFLPTDEPVETLEAISRELSLRLPENDDDLVQPEAISRELSLFLPGEEVVPMPEAISRELSLFLPDPIARLDGLIGWWRGEGDALDSIGSRHGVLQNGAGFGPGVVGEAFGFDGQDDALDLVTGFDRQEFTVALWVKPRADQGEFADLIDNRHNERTSWVIQQDGTAANDYYFAAAAEGGLQKARFKLVPDVWSFLVVTRSAENLNKVYVDAGLRASTQDLGPIVFSGDELMRLGGWARGGRHWGGQIDEVMLFDRALTEAEITGLFRAGASGMDAVMPVDLVVGSIGVSPVDLAFGGSAEVVWTLRNRGGVATTVGREDTVWLVGGVESIRLGTLTVPALVGAGETRTNRMTVALPLRRDLPGGSYRFEVRVNSGGAVTELSMANNVASVDRFVVRAVRGDLAVGDVEMPTTVVPGETAMFGIEVLNVGDAPIPIGWVGRLVLRVGAEGNARDFLMGFWTNGTALNAGIAAEESLAFVVPAGAPAGTAQWVIDLDVGDAVAEFDELDNERTVDGPNVVPVLTWQLPVHLLRETDAPIVGTIRRNGASVAPIVIRITAQPEGQLIFPAEVTLPAGVASVDVSIGARPDGIEDGSPQVQLTAIADGHRAAVSSMVVEDVFTPGLVLRLATDRVREGLTVAATVERSGSTAAPLVVALTSPTPSQFLLAPTVTIPAGQSSWTFSLVTADDSVIEATQAFSVLASGPGHEPATVSLVIEDDDLPVLTLDANPSVLAEDGGVQAGVLTIQRSPATARAVVVSLAAFPAGQIQLPATVTIPAYNTSVSVPIRTIDNGVLDGGREVTVSAQVFVSGTTQPIGEVVSRTLAITDDEAPGMFVEVLPWIVREGGEVSVRVRRNTVPTGELRVLLVADPADEMGIAGEVVIPDGSVDVEVPGTIPANDARSGTRRVRVRADATGHASGTGEFSVTDANLPDLQVGAVQGPATALVGDMANLTFNIRNAGSAPVLTPFTQRIYLSRDPVVGGDLLVATLDINPTAGGFPPGGPGVTQTFRSPIAFRETGDYWVVVETDANQAVGELSDDNNVRISEAPIRVQSDFQATVRVDLAEKVQPAGTEIPLVGSVTAPSGRAIAGKRVDLHLNLREFARVISAITDDNGRFRTVFKPLPGEAGHYTVGAAAGGQSSAAVQDGFTLVGARFEPAELALRIDEASSLTGKVSLRNLSELPLAGLVVELLGAGDGLTGTASVAESILPGDGSLDVGYVLTAESLHGTTQPRSVRRTLRVSTGAGTIHELPLAITVEPFRPRLITDPGELVAGVVRGGQKVVEFTVVNEGRAATGPLNLVLPEVPWLRPASTNLIPSLPPGGSNTISLLLTPATDLPLGPYTGQLAVRGEVVGLNVPFTFRCVSEAKGDLQIVAVDEYTYYAEGAPKVTNATVVVRDTQSGTQEWTAQTDVAGKADFPGLMEGYYEVEVTAPDHGSYKGTALLVPGQSNEITAFLPRELVKYTWSVEPTDVEDRTRIVVQSIFETVVPAPVITIEPMIINLAEVHGDSATIELVIRNHGLIAAESMQLDFPTHPLWMVQPLISALGVLPAGSTVRIPVRIERLGRRSARARPATDGDESAVCNYSATACWRLRCGPSLNSYCTGVQILNAHAECGVGMSYGLAIAVPPFGPRVDPVVEKAIITHITPLISLVPACTHRCLSFAAGGCAPGWAGCPGDAVACADALDQGTDPLRYLDCAVGYAGCVLNDPGFSCLYAILRCLFPTGSLAMSESSAAVSVGEWVGVDLQVREKSFGARSGAAPAGSDDLANQVYVRAIAARYEQLFEIVGESNGHWRQAVLNQEFGVFWTAFRNASGPDSQGSRVIDRDEQAALLAANRPAPLDDSDISIAIARWNRTVASWSIGEIEPSELNARIASKSRLLAFEAAISPGWELAIANGFPSPIAAIIQIEQRLIRDGAATSGVCSRTKLRLDQEGVLTRSAFRADLEIENRDGSPLSDVSVDLRFRTPEGFDANESFGVRAPVLDGITGVDGAGAIAPLSTGSATWTLLPTLDAAPTGPTAYRVGGVLSYTQNGTRITVPLADVPITVYPGPELVVDYFHQRDVFSDDPFTDVVEPAIPYSLGVMVRNVGRGEARNFRITSGQPRIVDNEKGLLIDFNLIGTEVSGQNLTPSLTANFGNIPAGTNGIGRWLFTSSLQGLFTEYKATFEHLDAIAGRRVSTITNVSIHEMIRIVEAPGAFADGRVDFLLNDVPDLDDLPDTVWLSDGTTRPVAQVLSSTVVPAIGANGGTAEVSVVVGAGFHYVRLPDPAGDTGALAVRLVSVRRSDGRELAPANFWQTDRTFIGLGRRPLRENRVHLFDEGGNGQYTLVYERIETPPAPTEPPVSRVESLAATSPLEFPVLWSGVGTGALRHDVYVSEDDGAFVVWLRDTIQPGSWYRGRLGHQYAFYTVAKDAFGNVELAPAVPDAVTRVTYASGVPQITGLTDVVTSVDEQVTGRTFEVRDADTAVGDLRFVVRSSNPALVPVDGVVITGAGELRGLEIRPAANRVGEATVTLGVSDGTAASEASFQVRVEARNRPPSPAADLLERRVGRGGRIDVATLIANDLDPDFQVLTVTSVASTSTLGARLIFRDGLVSYVPAAGQGDPEDSFTYVVSDGVLTATGSVRVRVIDGAGENGRNVLAIETDAAGTIIVTFVGVGRRTYEIQRTQGTDPTGPWVPVGRRVADATGQFQFQDTVAEEGGRFYRTLEVSP